MDRKRIQKEINKIESEIYRIEYTPPDQDYPIGKIMELCDKRKHLESLINHSRKAQPGGEEMRNKPKLNAKSFLKAIEDCLKILDRKTFNGSTPEERQVSAILHNETSKAYLSKSF